MSRSNATLLVFVLGSFALGACCFPNGPGPLPEEDAGPDAARPSVDASILPVDAFRPGRDGSSAGCPDLSGQWATLVVEGCDAQLVDVTVMVDIDSCMMSFSSFGPTGSSVSGLVDPLLPDGSFIDQALVVGTTSSLVCAGNWRGDLDPERYIVTCGTCQATLQRMPPRM